VTYVIIIPPTSRQRYLGGMAALNLPSPTGTGDWHMQQTFFRERKCLPLFFITGDGCPANTNHLLGDIGIYDCTSLLKGIGVRHEGEKAYAANHARAIVDLVIGTILRGGSPAFVGLDDWMPRDSDKQEVFDLLDLARPGLTICEQDQVVEWKNNNLSDSAY
jgi:hypothetical protein